jgi:hypothetical protein
MSLSTRLFNCMAALLAISMLAGCGKAGSETAPTSEPGTPAIETEAAATETEAVTTTADMYEPIDASVCQAFQQQASEALGVEFSLENPAPFVDEIARESGQGCKITATAKGSDFTNPQSIFEDLKNSVGGGWDELIDYEAGGPMGSATGMVRDMALMLLSANWKVADGVDCPSDQPISACNLTEDQKIYSVEIDVAQYKADFSMDGHWVDESTNFTLDLYQEWKNIWGEHSVVADNGNKIDSLEASINGRLNGKVATVQFKSSFSDETGVAEITYVDVNTIQWKVVSAINGENYFPAEATLTRMAQ